MGETGVAPGTGGMRPEYLTSLAQQWGEAVMDRLEKFGLCYLNGMLPPWFYRVYGAVTTVPLFKTSQKLDSKLMPVGMMPSFVRTVQRFAARDNHQTLESYLEPRQLTLSPAGAHKLVFGWF